MNVPLCFWTAQTSQRPCAGVHINRFSSSSHTFHASPLIIHLLTFEIDPEITPARSYGTHTMAGSRASPLLCGVALALLLNVCTAATIDWKWRYGARASFYGARDNIPRVTCNLRPAQPAPLRSRRHYHSIYALISILWQPSACFFWLVALPAVACPPVAIVYPGRSAHTPACLDNAAT